MFFITLYMGRTAKGRSTCVMPTSTPTKLCISLSGSSTTPSRRSSVFSSPPRPSITIQAYVRTSTLIQNGTITKMMSTPASRPGTVAMT